MLPQLLLVLVFGNTAILADFQIGVGMADVTGPVAEVGFMGYGQMSQKGKGVLTRLFARAFIVDDGKTRMAFVNVDYGMMGYGVRKRVIERLQSRYGNVYSDQNVILSGVHTHSAPGGFLQDLLFDLSVLGFVRQTFMALIDGITLAIERAHSNVAPGKIFINKGEISDANINRSPQAYLNNPEEERKRYKYDVDKDIVQLKFMNSNNKPVGVLHWFAVHPTSLNNTNKLVSSDNQGLAEIMFERYIEPKTLPGKGSFVAAFAATNLGDVSPNIKGPHCLDTGLPCDSVSSTCQGSVELCVASGPGRDMYESNKIIAERIFQKAVELFNDPGAKELTGSVKVIHQFLDVPKQQMQYYNVRTKNTETVRGCLPAMGISFAAGTTDGPGAFPFIQGAKTSNSNPLWNVLKDFIARPSPGQEACHAPKPILLSTGEMNFPLEWQPTVLSTQMVILGDLAIAAVPGEFTTMAGRRLRDSIRDQVKQDGGSVSEVVIAGLCNVYADYIVTPEEYQIQRYEGASTIYGPHTLPIFEVQYRALASALVSNRPLDPGPRPTELMNDMLTLVPGVVFDTKRSQTNYGDVLQQPPQMASPGDVVTTRFVSGHPRNNLLLEGTFLTVERQNRNGGWTVVATDGSWETKYVWHRTNPITGTSESEVIWEIPQDVEEGKYRIRHFGNAKHFFGRIDPYVGITDTFQVGKASAAYSY